MADEFKFDPKEFQGVLASTENVYRSKKFIRDHNIRKVHSKKYVVQVKYEWERCDQYGYDSDDPEFEYFKGSEMERLPLASCIKNSDLDDENNIVSDMKYLYMREDKAKTVHKNYEIKVIKKPKKFDIECLSEE